MANAYDVEQRDYGGYTPRQRKQQTDMTSIPGGLLQRLTGRKDGPKLEPKSKPPEGKRKRKKLSPKQRRKKAQEKRDQGYGIAEEYGQQHGGRRPSRREINDRRPGGRFFTPR